MEEVQAKPAPPSRRKERPQPPPTVPLTRMIGLLPLKFRVYTVLGSLAALAQGAVMPVFTLVFGTLFNVFVTQNADGIRDASSIIAAIFVGIGVYNLAVAYLSNLLLGLVGQAAGVHFRRRLWKALLAQDAGFFEDNKTGAVLNRFGQDIDLLEAGLGTKIAQVAMNMGQIVAAIIIAFIYSWKLSLVLFSISPLAVLGAMLQGRLVGSGAKRQAEAYQGALSFAVEVISSFRTVASFVWEPYAETIYNAEIAKTKKSRCMATNLYAVGNGLALFLLFAVYALGFWYGAQLVAATPANGGILLGDMLIVFFSVMMAAMGLAQMATVLPDFAKARVAAHSIMELMERVPAVDANVGRGVRDVQLQGQIELADVSFAYPARPDQGVLHSVTLRIPPGTVVGVVGESGSGKSTLVALLERFYDVGSGSIRVDGVDLREFWRRCFVFAVRDIATACKEPKLFDMSVEDNIKMGKPDATHEEVVAAATAANCHNFIMELGDQYATRVGEGGSQLSGGQKQRVAIARAFIKDPKILLLDEATSALDTGSEAVVQQALDVLMVGRTTIQIAHRLSTIRQCSMICVMNRGKLVEVGTHAELLQLRGHYFALVSRQMEPEEIVELAQSSKGRPAAASSPSSNASSRVLAHSDIFQRIPLAQTPTRQPAAAGEADDSDFGVSGDRPLARSSNAPVNKSGKGDAEEGGDRPLSRSQNSRKRVVLLQSQSLLEATTDEGESVLTVDM